MNTDRRLALSEGLIALTALIAATGTAEAAAKPGFLAKDGKAIAAKRTFTDADGKTHCDTIALKGVPVTAGESSLVPAGCTRYYEGKAVSMLIRRFIPGMKTDYHTDPAGEHQLTFMIDGEAAVGAKDGSSFHLRAGDFALVEDDHGEGHTAVDATGKGFTQLFVAMPAGG
jgi:quercetin dioxygenase-like cupin family protein